MKMRDEQEMFGLILGFAKADDRVRAVAMNGSRAVKNSRRDCFQDYDIVYIVSDVKSFACDPGWIDFFGERMIMQLPDDWHTHPYDYGSGKPFTYLMQFTDGTRIDLKLTAMEHFEYTGEPTVALLDKDGILPVFPVPTGECYFVEAPAEKEFHDCCNEFWWLCPYVAKELWREGLPYAKQLLEQYIRPELIKMLNWSIGLKNGFRVNTGKMGKYMKEYLSADDWAAFEKTYPDFNKENIWTSLFAICDMFRIKAGIVAGYFGYEYPVRDDKCVTKYLEHVRQLPENAKSIY